MCLPHRQETTIRSTLLWGRGAAASDGLIKLSKWAESCHVNYPRLIFLEKAGFNWDFK
jgi:hypothetical protein